MNKGVIESTFLQISSRTASLCTNVPAELNDYFKKIISAVCFIRLEDYNSPKDLVISCELNILSFSSEVSEIHPIIEDHAK